MTLAQISRPVQISQVQRPVPKGPTLIDPIHFKLIGGGLPHGTWAAAAPSLVGTAALPHGTW